jgi:hypothetical protein
MDEENYKRQKKSDKAKRKMELTGGLSNKHIRLKEALEEQKIRTEQTEWLKMDK